MPIGHADQKKIEEHMQGLNNQCPVCDTGGWTVCEDLTSLLCIDAESKIPIEGKILPMVTLICNDCGYVRQITAKKIGLI